MTNKPLRKLQKNITFFLENPKTPISNFTIKHSGIIIKKRLYSNYVLEVNNTFKNIKK